MLHDKVNLLFKFGVHLLLGWLELVDDVDLLSEVVVIVVEHHLAGLHHCLVLKGVPLVFLVEFLHEGGLLHCFLLGLRLVHTLLGRRREF